MTEHHNSTEERLAALEKYVKDDLWVTNRSFIKRTMSIYGHGLLGGIIIGAAMCVAIGLFALLIAVIAGVAGN